jgi:signal transduction histidine kinase
MPSARAVAAIDPEVPPQARLEARLHAQRLTLVRIFSAGLVVLSAGTCVAYLVHAAHSGHVGVAAVGCHSGILAFAGMLALYFCRKGRLREATYTVALPLISQATLLLALVADSHGIAVIDYGLVVSIAALTLDGRDWPRLALGLGVCTVLGALLHCFPVVVPGELPRWLHAGSIVVVTPIGLLFPMTLFWLYGTHLTASREEAWELARTTARANRLKTEFLATMSHELRSPMHVIIGNTQMMREGAFGAITPDQLHSLGRMETYAVELLRLIESALDVSRLESGRMPVHVERFAVDTLLGEVIEGVAATVKKSDIALRTRNADGIAAIDGDRLKVKEILQNLVTNAAKFTRAGFVELRVLGAGADVVFEVEDTGIGMPADDLPLIFESFRQLHPTGDEFVRGVGLGLYIVNRLVALLGGTVTVESALGRGTTFRVRLPLRESAPEAGRAGTVAAAVTPVASAERAADAPVSTSALRHQATACAA